MTEDRILSYVRSRQIQDKPFQSACYAPSTSLYFHTNGDVVACCKSTQYRLGNIAEERLSAIWSGERIAALRDALRKYDFSVACDFCAWQIENGHDNVHAKIYDTLPVGSGEATWPARMDFTISNTCNLACIMCYGVLSSTIRAHREHLPPLPRVYGDEFFTDLRAFLPHLQTATFMGGEPFLAAENHRIWEMMIEDGVAFPCHVITNGTQWNARVERVLDALPVSVSISIDGVTESTVESIRVNARFETVMANVARFHEYTRRKGTRMSLMFCLMRQNWKEFGAYLRFAEDLDVDVDLNVVVDPASCSLFELPSDQLRAVIADLESEDRTERHSQLRRNGSRWRSALHDLQRSAGSRDARSTTDDRKRDESPVRTRSEDPLARAWELIGSGRHGEALAELQRIGAGDARHYEALLCGGQAHRMAGDLGAAEAAFDEAAAAWPRGPQAFVERGWLRLEQQRPQDAAADAEAARSRLSGDAADRLRGPVHRLLATAYGRLGRREDALDALGMVPADDPGAYDAATTAAWICRELGRLDEAEQAIERALSIDPERAQALVERAWLRHAQGRREDGIAAGEAALATVRRERAAFEAPSAHQVLSILYRDAGRPALALDHAERLLDQRSGDPQFHLQRAELLCELGRVDEAAAATEDLVARWPERDDARQLLARLRPR